MVLKGWLLLLFPPFVLIARAQDEKNTCHIALGLSSGAVEDASISSPLGVDTTPSAGRLNNAEGAWCFGNDSIASRTAALIVDLGTKRFVSGFGSQGPPEAKHPRSYHHLVGFDAAHSLDLTSWEEFNGGNVFFDVDKNDTSDAVSYHISNTIEFTRYVKLNVTMHISGESTICLRFEIYGCDTDVQPSTFEQALTTTKGKIEVNWQKPLVKIKLESDSEAVGILRPGGYTVLYRPTKSQSFAKVTTLQQMVSLEDVRLGATYDIQLQCLYNDVVISCGTTQVEAYPPCPSNWTGGNEYHCFLYLRSLSSFAEARKSCLNAKFDNPLGNIGFLVDEDEKKFLFSRIIPKDASKLWLISNVCQDNEDCCKILSVKDGNTLEERDCSGESLDSALCLRDHKGEGAPLRVSLIQASGNGSSAWCTWRYEGTGWKTDELQVKLWTTQGGDENPSMSTFTTLNDTFEIKVDVGVMYSLLLKPAPNIRTEELIYKFIIIDFQNEPGRYGALLTPVTMSIYIIWSGSIRVTWDEAKALSKSGVERSASKYLIKYQMMTQESSFIETEVESAREFQLTPIAMESTYIFQMSCYFAASFQLCGEISIKTDPPDLVLPKLPKNYIIYQRILDKPRSWEEAEDDCMQRSGHLTSLLDETEGKALIKILPSKDAKMWTGAKLGRKGTGHWTDGQKITDLPMAKNSGVTSSSESCCRAINEMDRLRLAGGNCEDRLPYICKYTIKEIMVVPNELTATDRKWNAFELSWAKPKKQWLPTFYNVQACLKESNTECIVKKELKDVWNQNFQNLREFKNYQIQVEAVLKSVDVKVVGETIAMTFPKSPVRLAISPKGDGSVDTPMLTAMGYPDANVIVTVSQMNTVVSTVSGGVEGVKLSNLVPEETYDLVAKQDGGEWFHELSFIAAPTCLKNDIRVESSCYRLVEEAQTAAEAKKLCVNLKTSEEGTGMFLWVPQSSEDLKDIVENVGFYTNVWVDKPNDGSFSNIESEAACNSKSEPSCYFYSMSKTNIVSSACCDKKMAYICSYNLENANLGEVVGLLPSFVGNSTIRVEWSPPDTTSWSIRRYEIQWTNTEKPESSTKEVITGALEKQIDDLEFGTEYEIMITPLGATVARGEDAKILITTQEPRTRVVVTVDSDGGAITYSPLLIEKDRGSEAVEVTLFKLDKSGKTRTMLSTASGQAKSVALNGLELGQMYAVDMMPKTKDKTFNYSTEFSAFPSCSEKQIQDGLICVWAPPSEKSWKEAAEICKGDNGELLDYKTQKELDQSVKALLTTQIQQRFWLDLSESGEKSSLKEGDSSCPAGEQTEVMCCTYEVSEKGNLDDLKCSCCNEPRPFACKKRAKLNLGGIGDVLINDVTTTSLSITWTLASSTKWQKPSFLVTWKESSNRQKRETESEFIVADPPANIQGLKPGTKYELTIAPYSEATKSSGDSKGTTVATKDDIKIGGFMGSGCTLVVLKISCCVSVIVGSSFTVFVFIATRMFYLDCLAQIFAELGTFGAYVCILISSAQSYSNDNQCLRADPTLCIAVAVLIQFFFQVIFLFILLESLHICTTLKDYLPDFLAFQSPIGMAVCGFGIPAIMMIVMAAIASDGFSDGNDNCWLNLEGKAMLPSIVPVIIFACVSCLLLLSVFDADEPKEELMPQQAQRGRCFLKTRWACFAILALMSVCYGTGTVGAGHRSEILTYIFFGFSVVLGTLMPILRIKCDDEIREQLKRGLFASLKDDMGAIRVSPAPDQFEPHPLINMNELDSRKYKQQQLESLRNKESMSETVWHQ